MIDFSTLRAVKRAQSVDGCQNKRGIHVMEGKRGEVFSEGEREINKDT